MMVRYELAFSLLIVTSSCVSASQNINQTSSTESLQFQLEEKSLATDWIIKQLLDAVLPLFAPTGSSNAECRQHSIQYLDAVRKISLENLWALRMFDSSSKIQDGLLNGNVNSLGNFDECVSVRAPGPAPAPGVSDAAAGDTAGPFSGKHCYAAIVTVPGTNEVPGGAGAGGTTNHRASVLAAGVAAGLNPYLANLVERQMNTFMNAEMNAGDQQAMTLLKNEVAQMTGKNLLQDVPQTTLVRVSLCVPSSCRSQDVAEHITSKVAFLGLKGVVNDADCHTTDDNPLKTEDRVAISVLIVVGALLISSTLYDLLVPLEGPRREIFLAFSVYRNGTRLLDTSATGSDLLTCVNGIRVISISWVMLCHRWSMNFIYPTPFVSFALQFSRNPAMMYIMNGSLSVDSFFLISAMLVCYMFFKAMDRGVSFNWPLYVLQRYVRLTAAIVMVILLQVSLLDHAGTGPVWRNAQWDVNACRKNWWVTLLYVQNYVHVDTQCLTVTWYLAVDMQLYILSPIILLVLRKWPKVGRALLGFGIAAGIAHSFAVAFVNETHVISQGKIYYTHVRYTVWLIGIALGYILHLTKKNPVNINKFLVVGCWTLALFLTFGSVYLMAPFRAQGYQYNQFLSSLYLAYFRAAFAVGLSWVIFACARGYGGFVNAGLSWSFFTPLARLSYCIYLVHVLLQVTLLGVTKIPHYFDDSVVVPQFFGDFVMSTGLAAALYLSVEAPCAILANLVFRKNAGASSKKSVARIEEPLKSSAIATSIEIAEVEVNKVPTEQGT